MCVCAICMSSITNTCLFVVFVCHQLQIHVCLCYLYATQLQIHICFLLFVCHPITNTCVFVLFVCRQLQIHVCLCYLYATNYKYMFVCAICMPPNYKYIFILAICMPPNNMSMLRIRKVSRKSSDFTTAKLIRRSYDAMLF